MESGMHEDRSHVANKVLASKLHPDDQALVDDGKMHPDIAKALRHRRSMHFANDIEGPVHGGRLSKWIILAYAPPSAITIPVQFLISVYIVQFYEQVGATLGLLAFFQALARAFDVVTDPTMAYITDAWRGGIKALPGGRRRPFLFVGAPIYFLLLMCLLTPPPSLGSTASSVWFGFFYILFFFSYTFFSIPYDALMPELTDNQADRDELCFACTVFDGVGALIAVMAPIGYFMFIGDHRSAFDYKYQSCDQDPTSEYTGLEGSDPMVATPGGGSAGVVNALSSIGPWFFGGDSSPPAEVQKWSAAVYHNYATFSSWIMRDVDYEPTGKWNRVCTDAVHGSDVCAALTTSMFTGTDGNEHDTWYVSTTGKLFCADNDEYAVDAATAAVNAAAVNSTALTVAQEEYDFATWCECTNKADVTHTLDTWRYAYVSCSFFFGLYSLLTLWRLVFKVRERGQKPGAKPLEKPAPMVPSMLSTFNNKPFTILLPSWILDSLATALIGSLLAYFVRYIVRPEFSNNDALYGPNSGPDPGLGCKAINASRISWMCDSTYVLGAAITAMLLGSVLFMPVWLFLNKKFGKRNVWLLWSLTNGMTFLAFSEGIIGRGDVTKLIICSVINGAPIGAKFLADSIMADVIDYDEFLTGNRNEATFMMFRGFLPKIAAIPASAVPMVLLGAFGHVKPVDGVFQDQALSDKCDDCNNDSGCQIRLFIRFTAVYLPALLSFWAVLLKLQFPLRTTRELDMITEGIAQHLIGRPAKDACTGKPFLPVHFEESEMETFQQMGAFPGIKVVEEFLKHEDEGIAHLKTVTKRHLILSWAWLIAFAAVTGWSFKYLMSTDESDEQMQIVPVLAIVCTGMGFTFIGFTYLRYKHAKWIQANPPSMEILQKLLKQRQDLAAVRNFDCTIRSGMSFKPMEDLFPDGDAGVSELANMATESSKVKDFEEPATKPAKKVKKQKPPPMTRKEIKLELKAKLEEMNGYKNRADELTEDEAAAYKEVKKQIKLLKSDLDNTPVAPKN